MSTPSVPGLRLLRLIGEGACGRVYEAVRDGVRPCAVKVLDPEAINHAYLVYCFEKLRVLPPHPHVAAVQAFHPDDVQGPPLYAMPLYSDSTADGRGLVGRSLESRCGVTEPSTAWRWIEQLADGLAFLHLHAVVHCNLKPSNVFLTDDRTPEVVVADFGQGWIGGVEALPLNDHVFYAPPEQLRQPTQIQFGIGERWDVYAFGVTAYKLLTGRFPRGDRFAEQWHHPDLHGDLPDPLEFAAHLDQEAAVEWPAAASGEIEAGRRAIIDKCLRLSPMERWVDLREVRDALAAINLAFAQRTAEAVMRAEREKWQAAATETRQKMKSEARRAAFQGERRTLPTWAVAATAVAAAILGITSLVQHLRLQGTRALLATQEEEIRRISSERDTGFATRDTAVRDARSALAAAMESDRRAQSNLLGAQQAADQFFGSFMDAARQVRLDGDRSRLLLAGYEYFSKFIDQNSARPDLVEATLRARCHLADIKLAMGGTLEAADKYDEARGRIEEFLTQHPGHPEARAFQLRAADCTLAAARLRLGAGQADEAALSSLGRALATINAFAAQDADSPDLQRRLAEGQMMLAQSHLTRMHGNLADARSRVQHAADLINSLLGDSRLARPDDKLLLGRAYLLRGQLERRAGQTELALATQIETAQLLLECGDQSEALALLARCYGETGEMLDANGEVRDAARAHAEAIKVLSGLVKGSPNRPDWRFQLATRYADLAQLVRDHGEPDRALDYQRGAVELVKSLLDKEVGNATYAATLARFRADLSDLMVSLGKKPEALAEAREALALLDKLNLPGPPSSSADLDQRVSIAKSYGLVGHVAEDTKNLAEAQACFSKAVTHYESAAAASPRDDTIDRGLTWSKMRLAKLRP